MPEFLIGLRNPYDDLLYWHHLHHRLAADVEHVPARCAGGHSTKSAGRAISAG